ncbi:tetratricopeptide repeat protein [Sphingomonas sp. YR710]|jgi:tetratricopeptide (TPR) repeat protein|uniref:tetratricopeptide repeat protein n=1 Tax=Sphingomonas sp. YR710 TaxID=1882773 RepID=UPI000B89F010|nr:tetratricopeptide repeat protein [Sphingomonas sp. YR710]
MLKFRWKHLFSAKRSAIRRADSARDRGRHAEAAALYRAIIERWGVNFGLLVQCGNALKDSGSYAEADQIYMTAIKIRPDDADVFLQRGHLLKLMGDFAAAGDLYRQASALDPTLEVARTELAAISGWREIHRPKSMTEDTGPLKIVLRTDISMSASIIFHRAINQYRWRRG